MARSNRAHTPALKPFLSDAERQELYARLFHANPAAIALSSVPDGRFIEVNETFTQFTGYAAEEILGRSALELGLWAHPEDRDKLIRLVGKRRTVTDFEFAFRTKAGETRIGLLSAEMISAGAQSYVLIVVQDITERKRVEQILRDREEQQRAMAEVNTDFSTTSRVEPDGTTVIESATDGFSRVTGYGPDELEGGRNWMSLIEPEHRAAAGELLQRLLGGETLATDIAIRTRSGQRRWLRTVSHPLPDPRSGRVARIVSAARDITEIRTRLRGQEAVATLGQRALVGATVQELMDETARLCADVLEVEFVKILETQAGRGLLLRAGIGWREGMVGTHRLSPEEASQAGYSMQVNEPVIVSDLRNEKRFPPPKLLAEHGVISGVTVLIGSAQQPYGVLGVHSRVAREFTRHDIHFLQGIANVLAAAIERNRAEQQLARQQQVIRELSTPVLQVSDQLLILPVIGALDAERAMQLSSQLLGAIRKQRARVVVMDITGVAVVDTAVAHHLMQAVQAAKLLGASVILTGMSRDIAQALVGLGVELSGLTTLGDLQSGIEEANRRLARIEP